MAQWSPPPPIVTQFIDRLGGIVGVLSKDILTLSLEELGIKPLTPWFVDNCCNH